MTSTNYIVHIQDRYKNGASIQEIAKELGISAKIVANILESPSIEKQPTQADILDF